ncbi:MAG: DivIVA domain-containing protein [Solirubrobacteraceae bacterium MAG38_C4-C5]|nr:DivIVA domain-containing protein [Candidatus Siliceabacter maunaloa]
MASQTFAAHSVPEPAGPSNDLQATGAGLRRVEFPSGVWGYERHAVDAYVARVSGFVDEAVTLRRPDGAVRDALARVGEETSAVLQRATEVAEDITARSRTQADDRLARAEREATTIKEAAEARARELDAEIEHLWRERTRLLGEMERIAGELAALAKDADRRFPMPEVRTEAVSADPTLESQGETTGPGSVVPVPGPNEDAALADDVGPDDEAELEAEDFDDDFDDEDFALDEDEQDDEGDDTGTTVRYAVPAPAELQITRVLPRAGGHGLPRR